MIAAWWLSLDSVLFAPLLAVVLALIAKRRLGFLNPGSWLHQIVTIAAWGTLVYLALDELENLLTAWFIFYAHTTHGLAATIGYVTLFKDVAILLVAVPILASFPFVDAAAPDHEPFDRSTAPRLLPTVRALRIPAVMSVLSIAVLLGLPSGVRPQISDVVRAWLDTSGWHAVWAFAAAIALSAALFAACSLIANHDADISLAGATPAQPANSRVTVYLAVAVVGWVVFGLAKLWSLHFAPVVFPIAVFATVVAVTDAPALVRGAARTRDHTPMNMGVARSIALAPLFALGLLVLRSTQFAGALVPKSLGAGLAALALALGLGGWWALKHPAKWTGRAPVVVLGGLGFAAIAIVVTGRYHPLGIGWSFGSVAVLFVGLLAVLAVLAGIEHAVWNPPSGALAAMHVKRAPIFTVLILAVVLESNIDTNATFHAVHLDKGPTTKTTGPYYRGSDGESPAAEFAAYVKAHPPQRSSTAPAVVPIFVIASSGGGGRAQYWTLLTMNCLFANTPPDGHASSDAFGCRASTNDPAPRWSDVFVTSGISGGSVGLAMFDSTNRLSTTAEPAIVDKLFDRGFLDPTVATMVSGDLPDAVLHLARSQDRARTLENSWEDALPAMKTDFLANQRKKPFPILMLNSTDADDGCRINVSILQLASPTDKPPIDKLPTDASRQGSEATCRSPEPFTTVTTGTQQSLVGTRDVLDYVCPDRGDRLSYATAALLSARFPYVSPTGALSRCDRIRVPHTALPSKSPPRNGHTIYAVDGGYLESTGASPLVELFANLGISAPVAGAPQPSPPPAGGTDVCYQPVVLQLDNGYADSTAPAAPGRPQELIAPIKGAQTAAATRHDNAEQALAALASRKRCPTPDDLPTYLHVYPRLHPGTTAPLGWSLSQTAQDDMGDQLALADNQLALCNARRWLVPAERRRECQAKAPPPRASVLLVATRLGRGRSAELIPLIATIAVMLALLYFCTRQGGRLKPLFQALANHAGPTPTPPRWRPREFALARLTEAFKNGADYKERGPQIEAYIELFDAEGSPRGYAIAPPGDSAPPDLSVVILPDGTHAQLRGPA